LRSSSKDSTRLSTPDKALPALQLLNRDLYKWRPTSIVWCAEFHRWGVFIGVPGEVTDFIKSVISQVLASRPSHMAGRTSSVASVDYMTQVPFTTSCRASLRKLAGGCKVGPAVHPLGPHVSGFCTRPPRVRCIPWVTLILV
jgi:hypothetical protein